MGHTTTSFYCSKKEEGNDDEEVEEEEARGFNPVLTISGWSWLGGYDWTVQNQKRNGPWHPPS